MQAAEGARQRKASRIIGIDVNPVKFEFGKSFYPYCKLSSAMYDGCNDI